MSYPFSQRRLLLLYLILLLGTLLFGCGGQGASTTADAKTVESHKLQPPIPGAVPKGMNK